MQTIDALDSKLRNYLPSNQADLVRRAFYYAEQAHYGQYRRSGEPYVSHPLAVANILAEMRMDHQSLVAAMLHDVIEDTRIEKKTVAHRRPCRGRASRRGQSPSPPYRRQTHLRQ